MSVLRFLWLPMTHPIPTDPDLLQQVIQQYQDPGLRLWLTLKNKVGQMPPELFTGLLKGQSPATILELGTGYGMLAHYFALQYPEAQILGIDLNPKRIQAAQASTRPGTPLTFRHQNAMAMEEGGWDLIVMVDVLHHVGRQNQQPLIEKTYRLLKPGGRLLLREINPQVNWWKALNAHVFDTLFYWEVSHFLPIPTLKALLTQTGYQAIAVYEDYPKSWAFPYVTYLAHRPEEPEE